MDRERQAEGPKVHECASAGHRYLPNWATQPRRRMTWRTGRVLAVPAAPFYIPRGEPSGPPCRPSLPPAARGTQDAPYGWGRSGACAAAAAAPVTRGCPCSPPALSPLGPSVRGGHSGPPATVNANIFITPPRTRESGVSPAVFTGAKQGVTPSLPLARHYATR